MDMERLIVSSIQPYMLMLVSVAYFMLNRYVGPRSDQPLFSTSFDGKSNEIFAIILFAVSLVWQIMKFIANG